MVGYVQSPGVQSQALQKERKMEREIGDTNMTALGRNLAIRGRTQMLGAPRVDSKELHLTKKHPLVHSTTTSTALLNLTGGTKCQTEVRELREGKGYTFQTKVQHLKLTPILRGEEWRYGHPRWAQVFQAHRCGGQFDNRPSRA